MPHIGALLFSISFALFVSVFYTVILKGYGINIKYKFSALILAVILLTLSILGKEAFAAGIIIVFISVFALGIGLFVKSIVSSNPFKEKKAYNKNNQTASLVEQQEPKNINLTNYSGFVFHLLIIILLALSMFTYSPSTILNQSQIGNLTSDVYFQFSTSVFFLIIGIINPFLDISPIHIAFLEKVSHIKNFDYVKYLKKPFNWKIFKLFICLVIIGFLYFQGFFVLPNFDGDLASNFALFFILVFFVYNLIFLLKSPQEFRRKNIGRVFLLFRAGFISIFVAAFCVICTLLISTFFKVDVDKLQVTSESILLLGFNIVMAYVEFKLAKNQS